MKNVTAESAYKATKNACKLCAPLGAALVFKGIQGAVPLLHGSQGCSTYIRRYLISHFKEPVDIACSNFAEETAIFGGGVNLTTALENIRLQYNPELIGVATTCLSETIGDDVPMFIKDYEKMSAGHDIPPIVHVATPSYQGTHTQGFHSAVQATVAALAPKKGTAQKGALHQINLFPGMLSPADLRYLKEILEDFDLSAMMLPDISKTLDGPLWKAYERIPKGGTSVEKIRQAGIAKASLEFGNILAMADETAGKWLSRRFDVPCHSLSLPMGIEETDRFFSVLESISKISVPRKHAEERGRLVDSLIDGHKIVNGLRAVVYGEEDFVIGLVALLSEIGVIPVLCASGGRSGHFEKEITRILPHNFQESVRIMEDADFVDVETVAKDLKPDLFVGNSKGYTMARRLKVPLVRLGFPIHDRIGGQRLLHVGYRGAQQIFDRIANMLIEKKQEASSVGYTYM